MEWDWGNGLYKYMIRGYLNCNNNNLKLEGENANVVRCDWFD